MGAASQTVASDPGLTNANLQLVTLRIDGDAEVNRAVEPGPEDQDIVTLMVPLRTLRHSLDRTRARGA